jgi:hypothetical protein
LDALQRFTGFAVRERDYAWRAELRRPRASDHAAFEYLHAVQVALDAAILLTDESERQAAPNVSEATNQCG